MVHRKSLQKAGFFRIKWLISLVLIMVVGSGGGYLFYKYQKKKNTQKILDRAHQAEADHDWDNAATAYQLYLQRRPMDIDSLNRYANILLEHVDVSRQSLGESIGVLRRITRLRPENINANEKLTAIYLAIREYSTAVDLATRWLELLPDSVDAVLSLARAHHGLHENEESIKVLQQAINRMPDQARWYPPLIELLAVVTKQPEIALQWLEKGLKINSEAFEMHMAAMAYYDSQHVDAKADHHIQIALTLNPDHPGVLIPAAAYYTDHSRLDEAEVLLHRARKTSSDDANFLSVLASFAIRKRDQSFQESTADDLLEHADAKNSTIIARAAELYLRAGSFSKADECIVRLMDFPNLRDTEQTWLYTLQGAQAIFRDQPFAAIPFLTKAWRHNPADLWTLELLARAYERTSSFQEATEYYQQILVQQPQAAMARLALARLGFRSKNINQALIHLNALSNKNIELTENQAQLARLIRLTCDLATSIEITNSNSSNKSKELRNTLHNLSEQISANVITTEWLTRCFIYANEADQVMPWLQKHVTDDQVGLAIGAVAGQVLIEEGMYDQGSNIADEWINRYPDQYQGYLLRTQILANRNEENQVPEMIRTSKLADELRGQLWLTLSDVYIRAHNLSSAIEALRKAVELEPRSIAMRAKLARITPDMEEAKTCTDHIRSLEGDEGLQWRYERASYLIRLNPTLQGAEESLQLLQPCEKARPGWIAVRVLSGLAYEITGKYNKAAQSYRAAIAQQPGLTRDKVAFRLVEVLKRSGKIKEADSVLDTMIAASPDSADVLRLQTERDLRNHDLASAIDTAEQCLALGIEDPEWPALTAELHLRARHKLRAEEIARDALIRYPQSTTIRWVLARSLIAQDKADQAEEIVKHGVQKFGDAMHQLLLHQLYVQLKKNEQALQALEKAFSLDPDHPTVCGAASDYWARLGDRNKQLAYAKKAVELRGEDTNTSLTLANLYANGGSDDERRQAKTIVQKRLKDHPDDADALVLYARMALTDQPQDITGAQASLEHAIRMDPRSMKAYHMLTSIHMGMGRFDQARDTVFAGLTVTPNHPDLLFRSAELYSHTGDYASTISMLHQYLQIIPRQERALSLLVSAYRNSLKINEAIRYMEQISPLDQMTQTEMVLLATLYENLENYDHSNELFQQAIQKDEQSSRVYQAYMHYLSRRENYQQIHELTGLRRQSFSDDVVSIAVAGEILASQSADDGLRQTGHTWLSEIIENSPEQAADAAFRSGISYYKHGDLDGAQNMFHRASKLAPMAPRAVNALAWLYAQDLNEPDNALDKIESFEKNGGRPNAEILDTHAAILLSLGRLDEAKEKLINCLQVAGQSPPFTAANFRMGLLLMESGEKDEAISYIRHALELNDRLGGLTGKEQKQALALISS